MDNTEFDDALIEIIKSMTVETLLSIPGVYEVLAHELNNEVIESIERMGEQCQNS